MFLYDISKTSDLGILALTGVFLFLDPSLLVFNLGCTQGDGLLALLDVSLKVSVPSRCTGTYLHLCRDPLNTGDFLPLTLPLCLDRSFIIVESLDSLVQLFDLSFALGEFCLGFRQNSRKAERTLLSSNFCFPAFNL